MDCVGRAMWYVTKCMKLIKSELAICAFLLSILYPPGQGFLERSSRRGWNSDERSVSIFRYARESHVAKVIHFILLTTSCSSALPHHLVSFIFLSSSVCSFLSASLQFCCPKVSSQSPISLIFLAKFSPILHNISRKCLINDRFFIKGCVIKILISENTLLEFLNK